MHTHMRVCAHNTSQCIYWHMYSTLEIAHARTHSRCAAWINTSITMRSVCMYVYATFSTKHVLLYLHKHIYFNVNVCGPANCHECMAKCSGFLAAFTISVPTSAPYHMVQSYYDTQSTHKCVQTIILYQCLLALHYKLIMSTLMLCVLEI